MADTKLTALTETTSPATTDDVYIVTTPGGTPASKRCTIANLSKVLPGYEFDYVEKTTNTSITATTEGTAQTVLTSNAITLDGSTIVMIEFWAYASIKGTSDTFIILVEDSTVLGMTYTAAAAPIGPTHMLRRRTPSAASHTYYAKAYVDAGTGTVAAGAGGAGNGLPCFLRVYKV